MPENVKILIMKALIIRYLHFTIVCDIDIILVVVNKRIIFCFAIINVRYQEEKHGRESTFRPDLRCGR